MHYYKRNLGDYSKKAGRLSILQHGVYNLLLDACYDREKFPTREEAIDWTWAASKEELEAVDLVLRKFFEEDENGVFIQSRIKEELEAYWKRCGQNRKNRSSENNDESLENGDDLFSSGEGNDENSNATINHKPLTTNQEPKEDKKTSSRQKTKPPKWTQEDRDLAAYMLKQIREVAPSAKGSKGWPDHIRLMRERDGHSHAQIRAMFDWANNDDFWKANILSPETLRKQWPKLEAKRNSPPKGNGQRAEENEYDKYRKIGAELGIHPRADDSERTYIERVKEKQAESEEK